MAEASLPGRGSSTWRVKRRRPSCNEYAERDAQGAIHRDSGTVARLFDERNDTVPEGIDSISLNPDVAIATMLRVAAAEGGRSV
jgi:hypothetical protein